MTTLRAAAQQALEALENDAMQRTYAGGVRITNAANALRAALAEPEQEPVAWRTFDGEGGYDYRTYEDNENYRDEYIKRNGEKYASWVEPLYTAPPEAVEPIAWMVYTDGGASAYVTDNPSDLIGAYRALPLYTAPPQRKPLTDEELEPLLDAVPFYDIGNKDLINLARAIERAHGITGETK